MKGSREHREKIEEGNHLRMETSYCAFERHVAVPKEVSDEDIEAKYGDGYLEVLIHGASKTPAVKEPKAIPITKG